MLTTFQGLYNPTGGEGRFMVAVSPIFYNLANEVDMKKLLAVVARLRQGRERGVKLHFMVTERERELIAEKMAQLGTANMPAYLRKMAVDGYIVNLDLAGVRELVSPLRNATNNVNQIAKRVNGAGSLYAADVEDMKARYAELWETTNKILMELATLKT